MAPALLVALLSLTGMEIVLGIDNIVFLSILAAKLPHEKQKKALTMGIVLSLFPRIGLLFALSWIMSLTSPLFSVFEHGFTGRDLILLAGGLFLLYKSVVEIHQKVEGCNPADNSNKGRYTMWAVLVEMTVIGFVFSLDSVITAVGMVNNLWIIIAAVLISSVIMIWSASAIAGFIEKRPTVKLLALSFLLLIGVLLFAEGMGHTIDRAYVYFAMAFALMVEMFQLRMEHNQQKRCNKPQPKQD